VNSLPIRTPRFHTSACAATAGILLAIGIRVLVLGLNQPLLWGVVELINYRIKTRHADMSVLATPTFYWPFLITNFVVGLIILAVALRIAFWLAKPKPDRESVNNAA
jgi:hypothetical protein